MLTVTFEVRLPNWVQDLLNARPRSWETPRQRMDLVLDLARRHLVAGSGGPFAAAVFDLDGNELIAVGLNLVVPSGLSVAHAEVVALSLAQRRLGTHDLASCSGRRLELVTSAEPCCMCFGAIHWSGIRSLVCGARGEDVAKIGFDEGPKPADWVQHLQARGIDVQRDVERAAAASVLDAYAQAGGEIYNPTFNRGG